MTEPPKQTGPEYGVDVPTPARKGNSVIASVAASPSWPRNFLIPLNMPSEPNALMQHDGIGFGVRTRLTRKRKRSSGLADTKHFIGFGTAVKSPAQTMKRRLTVMGSPGWTNGATRNADSYAKRDSLSAHVAIQCRGAGIRSGSR